MNLESRINTGARLEIPLLRPGTCRAPALQDGGVIVRAVFILVAVVSVVFSAAAQSAANTSSNSPQAELAAALKQVERIINQPVTARGRTPNMRVATYQGGWFHPGATTPDFDNVDVRTTRETPYDAHQYVCADTSPNLVYVGRELEFNSMTKYFYKDRTVPKKKLTEAEMLEVNRLYRIIGKCQHELAQVRQAKASASSLSTDSNGEINSDSTANPTKSPRLLNPYIGGGIILGLVLLLWLVSKLRG